MTPAAAKTAPLYSESRTICGAAALRPAITAPAPSVTRAAGRAQHNSVPRDVNSATAPKSASRFCRPTTSSGVELRGALDARDGVAGIDNVLGDGGIIQGLAALGLQR